MRQVQVFKFEQKVIKDCRQSVKVPDFIGTFHQFGQEADGEGQSNPVAIIERADGLVETVYMPMIQFLAPPATAAHVDAKWEGLADGVTLRDYFAAKSLTSILAQDGYGIETLTPDAHYSPNHEERAAGLWARHAYAIADAMLAERAK